MTTHFLMFSLDWKTTARKLFFFFFLYPYGFLVVEPKRLATRARLLLSLSMQMLTVLEQIQAESDFPGKTRLIAQSSEIIASYWRERESWKGGKKFNFKSAASKVDGNWMQIKFCFCVLWFITVPSGSAGAGGVLSGMTLLTYWKSNSTTKHRKNRGRQMDDLQSSLVGIGRWICLES